MPPLEKILSKLPKEILLVARRITQLIIAGDTKGLDIKKLSGAKDTFRVRKGKLRVIYEIKDGVPVILSATRRSDTTYRKI